MKNEQLIQKIKQLDGSVTFGIDGMIDEVMEIVATRNGRDEFTKMIHMADFGNTIVERGIGGLAKERVLKRRSGGGFVYNTGRAAAALDAKTTFLGCFGKGGVRDIFADLEDLGEVVTIGEPANISVLEFIDGKIMMPFLEVLINFRWAEMVEQLGEAKVKELLYKDIIGVGYWSNLYDFENIMRAMVAECASNGKTKRFFHDFANLNKRSKEALLIDLEILKELDATMPQTLSLNEHEGGILAGYLGIPYADDLDTVDACPVVLAAAKAIQEKIGLDEVIIHTGYFAVVATAKDGSAYAIQEHCASPVKTTGAGDTFNGGYVVSSMGDLTPEERLTMANATTYCYVATGNPTAREGVMEQLAK